MEGSVFQADDSSRKELVQFAPWADHENIIVSPSTEIIQDAVTQLYLVDLSAMVPVSLLIHLHEGTIGIALAGLTYDPPGGAQPPIIKSINSFYLETTGTFMFVNLNSVNEINIMGGSATSTYDWVLGY